jgi:hypothetical protein
MGNLTTFTIYNDDCDLIKKVPKEFAEQIYLACCDPNINYRSTVFHGIVIPQKTRHADDKTVYVHAGNTVCEMNQYSQVTKEIMVNSPEFFKEMLILMEQNVKELKKQYKEYHKK